MNFGNFCILVVYVCLSFAVLSSGRKTSPEEMFLKLIHSVVESNQGKVIFRFSEFAFLVEIFSKKILSKYSDRLKTVVFTNLGHI